MKTTLLLALCLLSCTMRAQWEKIPQHRIAWVSQDLGHPLDTIVTIRNADTLTFQTVAYDELKSDSWTIKDNGKLKLQGKRTRNVYSMEFAGVYLMIWKPKDPERVWVYCPKL